MTERKITYKKYPESLQYETMIIEANTIYEFEQKLIKAWIKFRSIKRIENIMHEKIF